MDAGFYSADYLRAWIRSAQLRAAPRPRGRARTGGAGPRRASCCATLWREGTRPTSEEIAARLGFEPLDTAPLLHELGGDGARLRLRLTRAVDGSKTQT